jgi:DNA anti-recombination protein RmuC
MLAAIGAASIFFIVFYKFRELSRQNRSMMKDLEILRNYVMTRRSASPGVSGGSKALKQLQQDSRDFMLMINSEISSIRSKIMGIGENVKTAVTFFKTPKGIGQFGERCLRETLNMMGYELGKDYFEQMNYCNKIPDCSIKVRGLFLHVDSKVSQVNQKHGDIDAGKELIRKTLKHVKSLASKQYHTIKNSLRFVGLFLPTDGVFFQLHRYDPAFARNILEEHNIIIVSPMTLPMVIYLLHHFMEPARNPTMDKLSRFIDKK